jgi:hypothetical protein
MLLQKNKKFQNFFKKQYFFKLPVDPVCFFIFFWVVNYITWTNLTYLVLTAAEIFFSKNWITCHNNFF